MARHASSSSILGELPPDTEICGYRLSGLLGKGGMGAVYLAQQLSLGRQVAMKVLSEKMLHSQHKVEKFLAEARLAARLSHPALVTIHEVGQDPARHLYFYTMEYVHGRTLRTVINQEGALPSDVVRRIAEQMAGALSYAHKQGLIHRDVKPENVLLGEEHVAKLADLGLATAEARGLDQQGPRVISIVGTPGWSAPEQLRDPAAASPASDVFALGCLLSYMLTGQEPFTGVTLLDLAVRVATEPVAGLEEIRPPLRQVVEAFTAKDPEDRPATGTEALATLVDGSGRIASPRPGVARSGTGAVAPPRPRRRARRRR